MSANSSTPDKAETAGGGASSAPCFTTKRFTPLELSAYDGTAPGRPILTAYHGFVYDVTDSFMWKKGRHFWLRAGQDLSGRMNEGPHGEEMLSKVRCIGVLVADNNMAITEPSGPAPSRGGAPP